MDNHETENEIVFHDETPNQNFNQEKGPKNKLGITAFVIAILSSIISFIPSEATWLGVALILLIIASLIMGIVALSQIKKKNQSGKVFPILAIIVVILIFVISIIAAVIEIKNMPEEEFNDLMYCPYAIDCVDNGDGTSSCIYVDDSQVKCSTDLLKEDQFK